MADETRSAAESDAQFIYDPGTLAAKIQDWTNKGYHVLSPTIVTSSFAPGYGVNASLVLLNSAVDEDGGGTDVYFDKNQMGEEERAPSKIGLMKISAAAGVSWVDPYGRVDPLTLQFLWIYRVTGVYLAYDGTPQTIRGEKEIDYRDGSAQIGYWTPEAWREQVAANHKLEKAKQRWDINGWGERRVRQARANGAERAETGALERAIRTLGVKHTYTIKELRHPFVALRVCPVVDMTDPAVRSMVAQRQLSGVAAMYGAGARPSLPEGRPADVIDITPRESRQTVPVERTRTEKPAERQAQAEDRPSERRESKPPESTERASRSREEEDGDGDSQRVIEGFIDKVKVESRKYSASHEKAGQTFRKWTVTMPGDVAGSTVYPKWGERAEEADAGGCQIRLKLGPPNPRFHNEREILHLEIIGEPSKRAEREPGDEQGTTTAEDRSQRRFAL